MGVEDIVAQVEQDGMTVWVNSVDGFCLGRFGERGIDIHRSEVEQIEGQGQCLFCTHDSTTVEDWETFVAKVQEFFGVSISPEHKPVRFQEVL